MRGAGLTAIAAAALLLTACPHTPPPTPPVSEARVEAAEIPAMEPADETDEALASLAGEGKKAFATLQVQQDIHHGTAWYQGRVPARGSTAYLYLGKLGEGSSTLRFVVRYQGMRRADLGGCTVLVDGAEVGTFAPAPNRVDQPADGSVLQLADIHFDEVRPIILAMIEGRSAAIRTGDGAEIRLGRADLEEMRKVLAAYLHLQGSRRPTTTPAP